jgi:uncharacterized protein
LDCDLLRARGIRGVLMDLDNTLAPWRTQVILPEVAQWVGCLREHGLYGCLVTNAAHYSRVRPVAERLGIPWVARALKPLPYGFRRGMALLGTEPESTAMIGDLMTMDVVGSKRLGIYTVLVEPLSDREAVGTRLLQRPAERFLRWWHRLDG